MPQPERNTSGLAEAADRRHERALERARKAIRRLDEAGEAVSFQAVAREARVSRQFLYSHDQLRGEIECLRTAHLERGDPPRRPTGERRVAEGAQPDAARREPAAPRRARRLARRARRRVGRVARPAAPALAYRPSEGAVMSAWPTIDEEAFHGPAGEFCSGPSRTQKPTRWRCSRSSWSRSGARAGGARTTASRPTTTTATSLSCWSARPRRDGRAAPGATSAGCSPTPTPAFAALPGRRPVVWGGIDRPGPRPADEDDGQAPSDKRRLVVKPEFAQTLKVLAREGNTLSAGRSPSVGW